MYFDVHPTHPSVLQKSSFEYYQLFSIGFHVYARLLKYAFALYFSALFIFVIPKFLAYFLYFILNVPFQGISSQYYRISFHPKQISPMFQPYFTFYISKTSCISSQEFCRHIFRTCYWKTLVSQKIRKRKRRV